MPIKIIGLFIGDGVSGSLKASNQVIGYSFFIFII